MSLLCILIRYMETTSAIPTSTFPDGEDLFFLLASQQEIMLVEYVYSLYLTYPRPRRYLGVIERQSQCLASLALQTSLY